MFEGLKSADVEQDSACAGFIALYERFCKDASDEAQNSARIARFRYQVSKAWDAFGRSKQDLVVAALIYRGLLPEGVSKALRVFGGRVVSVV